ncbi:MAG: energy-coupling factor transporter transmembrane protein EcfT [Coriobacteriales bacterium]|jgi:energy-coupling factor transport system permease protein|nr:energy-coupling factor transporter transmembrane protein EcfT [Coriobacteriales bacterium]
MAIDSIIGQYYHQESLIHQLDPRVKLTLLLVFIVLAFLANSLLALALLLALLVSVALVSRIPAAAIFKALLPLAVLLIFPLLFNLFFIHSGNVLLQLGVIEITSDGVYRAIYMTLRLLFLFASATMLTLTTSTIAISDACAAMLRPLQRFGLPAFEVSMMLSIALRFIPILTDTYTDIRKAQQARGAVFSQGSPLARLRSLVPLLVPLFAQAFRHGEELATAMESRCYHGGQRTHYRLLKMRRADFIAMSIVGALTVALIVLRFF